MDNALLIATRKLARDLRSFSETIRTMALQAADGNPVCGEALYRQFLSDSLHYHRRRELLQAASAALYTAPGAA